MRRIAFLLATVVALCTGFATSASAGTIFFQLKVQHTLKCLQVSGGTTAVQSTCGSFTQQNQIFVLDPLPNTNYRIRNVSTNKCLDIRGANPNIGADVIEFACGTGAHQQWTFRFDGAGHYEVVSLLNQLCLDVDTFGGGTNNGARVQMWECLDNPALNQRWNLQSI
ncbi:hypothetical protein BBK82_26770 [Lentzea guizhouensis]|uniref:Ricin B lectin domain-containing protein n=1 Tax=Lentzea guizhouensis TaxID=1586287 RepID=A0A1B2HN55_9PSEU|nr:RICIN domain-containing protein [Lentzea guizhouensis]ANZ39140.1 hypothetical protein BBK82_26770 [Lentzea guizhouensis]